MRDMKEKIIDIINNNYASLPKKTSGIYMVTVPNEFVVRFTREVENKSHPIYCVEELIEKFNQGDKKTLYIGKAKDLQKRIKQYISYGLNKGKVHKGGRAIFQIEDYKQLEIELIYTNDYVLEEKKLQKQYLIDNKVLPLANWRIG